MHELTQEHVKLLAAKEWLPQADGATATPYFIKFVKSDDKMVFLSTDTRSVWTEVVPCRTVIRRWCKQNSYETAEGSSEILMSDISDLTSTTHSLCAWSTCSSFQPMESIYSEKGFILKFRIADAHYQWTWETNYAGSRLSADIISKQLLLPLLSAAHLGFSSSLPGMSQQDTQQAVDKLGRVVKRSLDIHAKNALSKPRLATVIQRLSAIVNQVVDLPPVLEEMAAPQLSAPRKVDTTKMDIPRAPSPASVRMRSKTPPPAENSQKNQVFPPGDKFSLPPSPHHGNSAHVSSATESESDSLPVGPPPRKNAERQTSHFKPTSSAKDVVGAPPSPVVRRKPPRRTVQPDEDDEDKNMAITRETSGTPDPSGTSQPPPQAKKLVRRKSTSEDEDKTLSSPPPPRKTVKRRTVALSSDSESEAAGSNTKRTSATRGGGTRQPIRRGGKKF